jgi:hypothetical protein
MKNVTSFALSVALLVAAHSFAEDAVKPNPFKEKLARVPSAELPAKAADLVLKAKKRDQAATTVDVIQAAVGINPAAAPAIVGAVARRVPEMASVAADAAVAAQPQQATAIRTAAASANRPAGTATRPRPSGRPAQTSTAASSAPAGATPISSTTPTPLVRGPSVGPPYIPLTTTPTNVVPGGSGDVPPGGRDYAAP